MEDKDIIMEELVKDNLKEQEELNQEANLDMEDTEASTVSTTEDVGDEDTNEEIDSQNNEEVKAGKSFFKKDKKEKKDKKDLKIEELNDRLMRTMAEFDNYRKRTEKEKAQMFEIGARDIIEKILPVIDNFERGLDAISEEEKEGAFAQGIERIYKQLLTTLEETGLKQIEALGKEFDLNFHNAVMHAEDPEYDENIVVEEFQKGYIFKETVVRHSMVKVVN